jgi:hypothetical protein
MPVHWTFAETPDNSSLMQGDVIVRVPEVEDVLQKFHKHFVDSKYLGFLVVTQSCDLVRRAGYCKTPYISLAVIRSLKDVIRLELRRIVMEGDDGPNRAKILDHGFASAEISNELNQLAGRIVNNNQHDYFFLRADEKTEIAQDACACLRVAISLRTDHYDALLKGKRAELLPVFQAKLGWLLGSVYSRVGTPDWDATSDTKKARASIIGNCMTETDWVEASEFDAVVKQLVAGGAAISKEAISEARRRPGVARKKGVTVLKDALQVAWPDGENPPGRGKLLAMLTEDAALRSRLRN